MTTISRGGWYIKHHVSEVAETPCMVCGSSISPHGFYEVSLVPSHGHGGAVHCRRCLRDLVDAIEAILLLPPER